MWYRRWDNLYIFVAVPYDVSSSKEGRKLGNLRLARFFVLPLSLSNQRDQTGLATDYSGYPPPSMKALTFCFPWRFFYQLLCSHHFSDAGSVPCARGFACIENCLNYIPCKFLSEMIHFKWFYLYMYLRYLETSLQIARFKLSSSLVFILSLGVNGKECYITAR